MHDRDNDGTHDALSQFHLKEATMAKTNTNRQRSKRPARRNGASRSMTRTSATSLTAGVSTKQLQRAAMVGAGVAVAGAMTAMGIMMRWQIAKAAGKAALGTRRATKALSSYGSDALDAMAKSVDMDKLLVRVGLRRRPLILRALPGLGIAAGIMAAGSAAMFFGPRFLRGRDAASDHDSLLSKPDTNRSNESNSAPMEYSDPNGSEAPLHA